MAILATEFAGLPLKNPIVVAAGPWSRNGAAIQKSIDAGAAVVVTETITLEEALDSFKLPRTLGEFEDKSVVVGVGKFGPYIRHNAVFVSVPKDKDPMELALEEAIELINAKREVVENKVIKTFDENPDMQVLNGRYGPYIAYQKKNYKIPEGVEPQNLDLEACFKVIELQKEKKEVKKIRQTNRKK